MNLQRNHANMNSHKLSAFATTLFASTALLLYGCSRGPSFNDVSGTVTFDGKPVPAGRIYFNPDFSKGNDGPQGFADIKDGKYDTRNKGQGHAGGPMVISVEGFDGKSENPDSVGKPIFVAYEIKRELPKGPSVQALEVPASAAKGLVVPTGPGP